MAYRFDISNHHVFQPAIIPKSHHAPPHSIILELTIQVSLITLNHNRLANLHSVTNALSSRITLDFDFGILKNERRLRRTIAHYLNGLGINTWSVNYDNLIREIMECGLRMADRVVKGGDKRLVLPLLADVFAHFVEPNYEDMRRAFEESEAELERANYGMIAAKGSSIEEMLKKVRVEDETDCMVCLEKIKVRRNGSRMPCSHIFHAYCIKKWLKQSHYCPICRYEMPTNDGEKDMNFEILFVRSKLADFSY